ncbi:MAG: ribonuclease HII [Pelagibacterales bacterium]|nr:ribonuclease HII [Pelagibacterales bacterium]MBL6675523.1 ribonuclease HII [Alphaproteobacteria bacterium]
MPDFSIEKELQSHVIGLDEVGRGPLAGPVISCGCYFKNYTIQEDFYKLIGDSKKLSEKKRKVSFEFLQNLKKEGIIDYHLGIANVEEIDALNILEATKLSMKRVVDKFDLKNAHLIIDGNFSLNYKSYKENSIIKGDDKSLSIAAASIIAKVHRDRLMKKLSIRHQHFGWEKNAGYGTKLHIENIYRLGPTRHHRKTFEPIKSLIHS